MIQLKKTLLTLVALLAVTTGAWAGETTVTWVTTDFYGTGSAAFTKYDVTVTPSNNDARHSNFFYKNGANTFTTTLGNFTKIEIVFMPSSSPLTVSGWDYELIEAVQPEPEYDPDYWEYTSKLTWTGDAESVSIQGLVESIKSITFTIAEPSSGPDVAWDKDKKTGSFKMPGGNVTLEPEYYPQAALTAAPTAINDVPATTDGAILKAGTVATIGETTTAQGTVMYYVSTTALDDDALLALAADKWTADVPTAKSLAQGQAYVYYYVRGNDGDTDAETFSDGDILATNALTVTIAAAPTYAVTFAEGVNPEPPAEPEWTASPAAGVTKGQTVTVTYSGSKKVIGVKAEKKAAESLIVNPEVGQYIGSDGKNYDANATLPDGVTKVAMIAYVGNDAETSTTYNHGLALALEDVSGKKAWCSQKSATCLPTQYSTAETAKGDMAGIANTDALVNHTGHTHAAASAARNYNSGTHPAGTSAWFLPSAGQWDKMANAAGDYATLRDNAGLNEDDLYLSSTEYNANFVWDFNVNYGDWGRTNKDYESDRVRACLAF